VALSPTFSVAPATVAPFLEIACSPGLVPLGGGYELFGSTTSLTVLSSQPLTGAKSGWRVIVRNNTGSDLLNVQVRLFVTCAVMR
jgi:hypothetical protein